jgi:carbon monoxide dehydrogenase subunit G
VNLEGERTFAAPRATVWEVLNDPAAMAQTMPGVESFDVQDDRHWTANVKIPLGLGGLKMKVDMEKVAEREPEHAELKMKGSGVGAMLSMQTKFELAEASAGGTEMKWSADVRIAGPVGSMGQRVLQPIVNQQVQHVLGALDKQVQERAAGPSPAVGVASQGTGETSGGAGSSPEPSTEADAPPAEGPTDYGPPAESTDEPEPASGTSGAEEGVSPWSPEQREPEPEGPTPSTEG